MVESWRALTGGEFGEMRGPDLSRDAQFRGTVCQDKQTSASVAQRYEPLQVWNLASRCFFLDNVDHDSLSTMIIDEIPRLLHKAHHKALRRKVSRNRSSREHLICAFLPLRTAPSPRPCLLISKSCVKSGAQESRIVVMRVKVIRFPERKLSGEHTKKSRWKFPCQL